MERIIKGCWQLSEGHGASAAPQEDLATFADAGILTFDCADIYTGAEEALGRFRSSYGKPIRVHTKFVPDLQALRRVDRCYVERIIDRSLQRLKTDQLDLVQFHWWDFDIPGYLETGHLLAELVRKGKIGALGTTNFDAHRLAELVDSGLAISSNQVQYSLLDRRPSATLAAYCLSNQIEIISYGTLAGGFLSEGYLGAPKPVGLLSNRSLTKYKLIIDECGGWEHFQNLLGVLGSIAGRHGVSLATVALKAALDLPGAGRIIVGGSSRHIPDILASQALRLDQEDRSAIQTAVARLKPLPGDAYSLERIKNGPHASIMRYNLNS